MPIFIKLTHTTDRKPIYLNMTSARYIQDTVPGQTHIYFTEDDYVVVLENAEDIRTKIAFAYAEKPVLE